MQGQLSASMLKSRRQSSCGEFKNHSPTTTDFQPLPSSANKPGQKHDLGPHDSNEVCQNQKSNNPPHVLPGLCQGNSDLEPPVWRFASGQRPRQPHQVAKIRRFEDPWWEKEHFQVHQRGSCKPLVKGMFRYRFWRFGGYVSL